MGSEESVDEQGPAVIQAAQDNCHEEESQEHDMPGSPRSDSEWEVIPRKDVESDCGSSAKSLHMDGASGSSPEADAEPVANVVPHLTVRIVPQGSSDVSVHLTAQHKNGSAALSDSAQQQYQEQLRKAQDTLLPQTDDTQRLAPEAFAAKDPAGSAQDEQTESADEEAAAAVAELDEPVNEDLPTSTHMSMQADTLTDTEPASDGADASTDVTEAVTSPSQASQPSVDFPVYDSTGELSFMSDGSFINAEDAMPTDKDLSPGQDESALGDLAEDDSEEIVTQGVPRAAVPVIELSQQANEILDVARQLSEDISEDEGGQVTGGMTGGVPDIDGVALDETQKDDVAAAEPTTFHKYTSWSGFAAVLHHRLGQLLSTIEAWTASAYGCLPSSASVYAGTFGMFGPKSPLRRLDGLHWMLASGLALVSAALGVYIMKGQHLKKQVNNSNTELSRLLLKVINLQQSLQSPGRVPIIRHTSSMSTMTPFPLIHLL